MPISFNIVIFFTILFVIFQPSLGVLSVSFSAIEWAQGRTWDFLCQYSLGLDGFGHLLVSHTLYNFLIALGQECLIIIWFRFCCPWHCICSSTDDEDDGGEFYITCMNLSDNHLLSLTNVLFSFFFTEEFDFESDEELPIESPENGEYFLYVFLHMNYIWLSLFSKSSDSIQLSPMLDMFLRLMEWIYSWYT